MRCICGTSPQTSEVNPPKLSLRCSPYLCWVCASSRSSWALDIRDDFFTQQRSTNTTQNMTQFSLHRGTWLQALLRRTIRIRFQSIQLKSITTSVCFCHCTHIPIRSTETITGSFPSVLRRLVQCARSIITALIVCISHYSGPDRHICLSHFVQWMSDHAVWSMLRETIIFETPQELLQQQGRSLIISSLPPFF